jgi:hypothetical protein
VFAGIDGICGAAALSALANIDAAVLADCQAVADGIKKLADANNDTAT